MGIHPFHLSDASKLQQEIAVEKRNFTVPYPGNISQVKDSNTKAQKDQPLREGKIINTTVCQEQPSRQGELMNTKIRLEQQPW